jgi:hypothetical protein
VDVENDIHEWTPRRIALHTPADCQNFALNPKPNLVPGRQCRWHRIETGIAKMEPAACEVDFWVFSPIGERLLHPIDSLSHREQTLNFFGSKN